MIRLFAAAGGAFAIGLVAFAGLPANASNPRPHPGTQVIRTDHSYQALIKRLDAAVTENGMGVVSRASATVGAKRALNMDIPGNMVVGVFHPRFAVRMLGASVPAGVEAPLRFYITENMDNTATLTYRTPSSVFAPYENRALDAMAKELDAIFAKIAAQATK